MARLRTLLKTAAAEAACRTGADRLLRAWPGSGTSVLVLGYHQVVEAPTRSHLPGMLVSCAMLERQLDCVGRRFSFVSLDEIGEHLKSGVPTAGRPLAAVTFDDGYRDIYEHAFPLLKRKGIPAAVFVVTNVVGTARLLTHDRLYLLLARALAQPRSARARFDSLLGVPVPVLQRKEGRAPRDAFMAMRALVEVLPMSRLEQLMQTLTQAVGPVEEHFPGLRTVDWDMVRAMHRAGFTIGSHTCDHALLTLESADGVRQQLVASRQRAERELGAPVRHFAYPDGAFNGNVVHDVATAGYRFAYTTCQHRDRGRPLLTVPRRFLWENSCQDATGRFSPTMMRCQVQGLFDLFARCRQDHTVATAARLQPAMA